MSPSHAAPRPSADSLEGVDPREREREATAGVGLVIGFAALVMTFATLLLAYGIVRVQTGGAWPPPNEPRLPRAMWPWPVAATAVVCLASWTMLRATRAFGAAPGPQRARRLNRALAATGAAGAAFLAIQISGATRLLALGLRPSAGIGMSVVYAFTAFHAAHALAACVAVGVLWARVLSGRRLRRATVTSVAAFVHLVAALWLVVCAAVYVL